MNFVVTVVSKLVGGKRLPSVTRDPAQQLPVGSRLGAAKRCRVWCHTQGQLVYLGEQIPVRVHAGDLLSLPVDEVLDDDNRDAVVPHVGSMTLRLLSVRNTLGGVVSPRPMLSRRRTCSEGEPVKTVWLSNKPVLSDKSRCVRASVAKSGVTPERLLYDKSRSCSFLYRFCNSKGKLRISFPLM